MERRELLSKLDGVLSELDKCAEGEEIEELAAELEDAIFLLECAEDDEETDGALEEIDGLAARLKELADSDETLERIARKLMLLINAK